MNTSTSVYEDLKSKIIKGNLAATSDLTETELSANYKVSRNTVKKALLMLAGENLISMEPNKGAKVKSYSVEEVLDHLEVRATLEGLLIRLIIDTISEEGIHILKETVEKMKMFQQEKKIVEYSEQNQIFHNTLYSFCPNQTLVSVIQNLKTHIKKYNMKTNLVPGRSQESIQEHVNILEAIVLKDYEKAEQAITNHILNVRKTFKENYNLLM